MLTTEKDDFPRLLQSSPLDSVAEEERTKREAYRYQKVLRLSCQARLLLTIRAVDYSPHAISIGLL
jgi:ferredoxin